jgi:hypothetical protein
VPPASAGGTSGTVAAHRHRYVRERSCQVLSGPHAQVVAFHITTVTDFRAYPRTPPLTGEADQVTHISRGRVPGGRVRSALPWLYELYHGDFLTLAGQARPERVAAARDDRYDVVLDVQRGTGMRFECHVDSNPLTGLLFFTDHSAGGGELVFAHDTAADGRSRPADRGGDELLHRLLPGIDAPGRAEPAPVRRSLS